MKNHNTFSLKGRQTRIVLYLLMATIAVIVSFSVAGAWFMDRDKTDSEMPMGSAVIVKLVGTGEDGAIQNFKELYNSDGGAYPGDKILDSIKVQMGENTEESVLRVQYAVNILDADKNVKTENLTESETKLVEMLESDLKSITTLYSSDWAQTSSDWIYYKHLASGKTKPIELFDEYSLPLPDAQMDNSYQELSFRISLVAEAIQAANIMSFDEWNNDITNLSDSALIERVIKYNGERFADVDEVLPYIETTGGQYIDTGYVANLNTAVETTFQTNANNVWLFGSRTSGGASNTYAVHVSSMNTIWFQMANDSSGTQFSVGNIEDKQSTLTVNKDAAYLNGTQIGTVGRTSFGNNTLSLYLGVINANGSGTDRPFVGKIYSMRIWDNGQLVRFFVPARDKEGNVGFYDLVTKDMYLNEGTGSFAYGHSINYVANGGTIDANAPKTFDSSDLPITLPTPIRTGYEFGGWFLSSNFSGAAQTTIPVGTDNNVYLYAKWIKTYKITYHLGGGENAESNPQTFNEKTLPLTLAAPTREGFTFGGWYQNPAYSGSQVTTIEIGTEKNVSLWAKWDAIEYSITYILNGGTNSDQNVTKFTILDTPVKLFNPTYEGYVFEGWFASSDFSGERKTYLSKDNFGDITLYAKWSLAYTITYNTNGGLNDGRNPSVFTESTETFTLYGATKVNFTFLGWFDNEELSGTPITQITKGTKKNIVLWAKWSSTQITVTFDPNGGGVSPVTKVVKKGGTYVELPIPTKAGYTFDGWFTEVDGGTQVLPTSTVISDADHTLFAHWTENVYTVTYNLDGGTNAAGNPATFKRSDLPIVLLDATKDGTYFAGWYTDTAFTKRVTKIDAGSLKNVELWARFSSSPLVFDLVGTSAYSVRAANATISGDIEIPATYNGKPVGVIQNYGFKDCANLTSISIPSSVKSIGINAFENCSSIAEVVIPEGVILVANNTFLECANLASVTLPATLENIGANAFSGCTSLTTIVLPKNIEEIGANAFANCSTLDVIEVFGDTPATLKTGVFTNNISKIYVKPSLVSTYKTAWTEYKDKIFGFLEYTITYNLDGGTNDDRNVASFTKIDLPIKLYAPTKENADFLGWYISSDFSGESITEITTTENITLFARWDRKMTITYVLNGGKNNAANLSTITESMLPYTLLEPSRYSYVFLGWFLDESLTMPTIQITSFGNISVYAKWEWFDPYLEYVLNSDGTGYIVSAKEGSKNLISEVIIPDKYKGLPIKEIAENGFENCINLSSITIGENITKIGSYAFWDCKSLKQYYFNAVNCSDLSNNYFSNVSAEQSSRFAVTIGEKVTRIPDYLFYSSSSSKLIKSVDFNNNNVCNYIGRYAFYNSSDSLVSITIPNSVTTIGEYALVSCGLTKVNIFDLSAWFNITFVGSNSNPLYDAHHLYLNGTELTEIIIPNTITKIKQYALCGASALASITIPHSVSSIDSGAFQYCSSIIKIYIPNSVATISASYSSYSPFYGWDSTAVIYCEAESKPNDWGNYWNNYNSSQNLTIVWGAKGFSTKNSDWEFVEKTDGGICLIKYIGSSTNVEIPSEIEAVPVSEIAGYCFKNTTVTKIKIPNTIINIGSYAFENCNSISSITIPSNVTTIGGYIFNGWNDNALIFCEISNKPTAWDYNWNSNGNIVLATLYNFSNLKTSSEYKYALTTDGYAIITEYIGNSTSVVIPEAIDNNNVLGLIGSVFANNIKIKEVFIPSSITSILANAFTQSPFGNSNLNCVIYTNASNKLTNWSTWWNYYDSNHYLTVIWNSPKMNEILSNGEWKYQITGNYVTLLKYVGTSEKVITPTQIAGKNVTGIAGRAFYGKGVSSVEITNNITNLNDGCLAGCNANSLILNKLPSYLYLLFGGTADEDVTYVAETLNSVMIRNGIIVDSAMKNCRNINSIIVQDGVTSIGVSAFEGCSSLKNLTIPFVGESLSATTYKGVLGYIFGYKQFYSPDRNTYSNSNFTTTYLGNESNAYCQWSDNAYTYKVRTGGTILRPKYTIYYGRQSFWYYIPSSLKNVTVTSGDIKTAAFCRTSDINVTISGAGSIGNYAFYESQTTSVTIENGVTNIGEYAFQNCTSISKIYIPNSVTTISASSYTYSPFYNCNSSVVIYCEAASKPSGWGTYWNYYSSSGQLSVVWGASGLPES